MLRSRCVQKCWAGHSDSLMLWTVEVGDTSLPLEQPDMMDDELLQKLHHALMEVRRYLYYFFTDFVNRFLDPRY